MSLGSMRARAALGVLGVVVSMVLTAAPSLAAMGGNSANAKLCQKGGWQQLHEASTGLTFTS